MIAIATDRERATGRRDQLKRLCRGAGAGAGAGAGRSASLLLADTLAAIGFAAGLAGAVVAVPHGVNAMLPWLGLALLAGGARGLFVALAARIGARGARLTKIRLRRDVVTGALHRDPGGTGTTGALLAAAVDEVEALDGYVSRFLPARHAAALAPLIVLAATAAASPVAAGILLSTLVPFIVVMALAGGAAADESRRQFAALARLSSLFADRLRALPVILAFRAEDRETGRLATAAQEVSRRTMRVLRIAFISSGALEFFAALSVALVAVYAGFNLLGLLPFKVPEKLDLGHAFFVLALAPEFYAPMRRLAAAYHDRQAAETAAERLAALAVPVVASTSRVAALLAAPEISFENVTIRYPDAERDAVAHLSFDVAAGETVALVGPSGSGKSSVLHLLLGLAPLSDGRILLDGLDLSVTCGIAGSAAWAGQIPLILPMTIARNIALARPEADESDIEAAAIAAGLGPTLAGREQGLATLLDTRGSGLSGGERRRIGLARAILTPAPLLLLDEPTAHLDIAAETALIEVIRTACSGRTALIATHSSRLAAIADRIVYLEGAA
jgi:ATP-binding cassette subfamily C protein CydD